MSDKNTCNPTEHNFTPGGEVDTRKNMPNGDTEIHRPFVCTKCGVVVIRHVATWEKRVRPEKAF
jgi:hypothetical protein